MSFTDSLYLVYFTSGFAVGFGHCIGMCGPIVVSMTLGLKGRGVFVPHALYNLGRITTYAVLGGIMGATGAFTGVTAGIAGVQKGIMILAGAVIIVMGAAMADFLPVGGIFGLKPLAFTSRFFSSIQGKIDTSRSSAAYYPLGLVLGLLPCGPVYTAMIAAVRSGMDAKTTLSGTLSGMGLMAAFGIGTAPALLLVAKLVGFGWLRKREIVYKIGAVMMILMGVYFLIKGIRY